jgi:hypothetical protein
MRAIQTRKPKHPKRLSAEVDLRTPSGRVLPF